MNRRTFLDFLGKGALGTALWSTGSAFSAPPKFKPLKGVRPTAVDAVVLAKGFNHSVLIQWGDRISEKDTFGFNNDFTAFLPFDENKPTDGLLWVNHEYVDPLFVSGYTGGERTKEQVDLERYEVGGSIVRIKQNKKGKWAVVENDPLNRRITGATPIPFNWKEPIAESDQAIGTLANCSGGITPWGTILTCEENYDQFYGERNRKTGALEKSKYDMGWLEHYPHPTEHYGWVVEVDPKTGEAKKHIALGRCAHECATVKELPDGRLVVYTGDDKVNECLYKFVGSVPGSLSEGTLYVANTVLNRWESLKYEDQPVLQKIFKSQTEVLINLREAAKLIGGTALDRPEDIEIDPINGNVLISLTNNTTKDNYFGSILKIEETDSDHSALTFQSDTYLAGGEETGFCCPDNMAFDGAGNLWFTSDMSGRAMHKDPYIKFKNNGLFVVPRKGPQAGEVVQIGSAPSDAEFTGPWFSPDGKTLFLSVQHPGENSQSLKQLTSNWPKGGDAIPRSAVITISGKGLEELLNLEG